MRQLAMGRGALIGLLVITTAFAVYASTVTFAPSGVFREFLSDWLYNYVFLAAAAACALRGLADERDRAPWILVGAALCAWGIGDTYWVLVIDEHPNPPYPSWADAGFLAFYPLAYAGLIGLLRRRTGEWRTSLWLDGMIGGLAAAALGTAVIFQVVLDATGGSPAAVATNLAYPLADLILIALVIWGLGLTGWRPGRTWGLIAAGLIVFAISDSLYLYEISLGTYQDGSALDLGWLAGAVLLAWAAWQPREEATAPKSADWMLLLPPVVFACVALGVLVYGNIELVNSIALVLAGSSILAVIARMALAFGENATMIAGSRSEARTDVLTGLGNRRRLLDDIHAWLDEPDADLVLALYDLNGFKVYNDTFGHPAGDELLGRLGRKLATFAEGQGAAYRMGGDEFCVLLRDCTAPVKVVAAGAEALRERGEGFEISAASGSVRLPAEARTASDALRLADQRMYRHKNDVRSSIGQQSSSLLLRLLSERRPTLGDHVAAVAELSEEIARALGLPPEEVTRARLVAELHEVGKMAIPDAILDKPGRLTHDEWQFVQRHPVVAERILLGSPVLAHVAPLVRSTNERFDGQGYPDGLTGEQIPLISRIVLVADAFESMRERDLPLDDALAEINANSGSQFDPAVVGALGVALAGRIALAS